MEKDRVQENRLWNFRQIVRSVGSNEVAAIMGKHNSYITQLAGPNPKRNIGNKIAKQIEEAFKLAPGSLDADPPQDSAASNKQRDHAINEITSALANTTDEDRELVLNFAKMVAKISFAKRKQNP
jgi:hypothetical protein